MARQVLGEEGMCAPLCSQLWSGSIRLPRPRGVNKDIDVTLSQNLRWSTRDDRGSKLQCRWSVRCVRSRRCRAAPRSMLTTANTTNASISRSNSVLRCQMSYSCGGIHGRRARVGEAMRTQSEKGTVKTCLGRETRRGATRDTHEQNSTYLRRIKAAAARSRRGLGDVLLC